ncbi:2-amino-4-hydroxy-6-hydroxymethyldihydropteridine diphosphokinase [Maricurvus nonylphenolicus]|uniref:2-amino-4-hydroxy-6- hydroxymethyldihydropteridine diphosphokinase n=1 Tax=Maricurvus nonylphenolicus TaxID=1008307 RepID=UPI0036F34311
MARVYLSLGSNIDRYRYISAALDALAQRFGELIISSVYESEAVGFEGDNFLNLVVGLDTTMELGALASLLRKIEHDNDRRRDGGPRFSARTLDIDILTYDDLLGWHDGVELPRDEILTNAFVLWPLAEVAADELHPEQKKSYGDLWQAYDRDQLLWPVDFTWQERQISRRQ